MLTTHNRQSPENFKLPLCQTLNSNDRQYSLPQQYKLPLCQTSNSNDRQYSLPQQYVTDISKWLQHFFGLAFLNPEDVGDIFAEDLIPDSRNTNIDGCEE
jgi:hypothetical protein